MNQLVLDRPLTWRQVAAIAARGERLELSAAAKRRIEAAHAIVRALVERDIRAYGVNTGVGALADTIVPRERQNALSHNILMSHAVGVGPPLSVAETRAIMAAAVNNFAHGYSGPCVAVVERIVELVNAGCTPVVPRRGSVGYLSHMAHIGLALIGKGRVMLEGEGLAAAEALTRLGLTPLILEAKEGLSLVNGTPCATGLACLALDRAQSLMDWADAIAAMTFETQRGQIDAFNPAAMALRASPGLLQVTETLNAVLADSPILAAAAGGRTQDALSLRSIPQVHGAVRDVFADVAATVQRELASVTDNPVVMGSPATPQVHSQAHAVGAAIALAMDQFAVALAQLGAMSEKRIDRMVNPLISGLPGFLAGEGGVASGFMIAQYTAVSLTGESRRLAAPASLDGGLTSGLQEDMLSHATPSALKALDILGNLRDILAIELLAACQSYDILGQASAPRTRALHQALRAVIPPYADDRPLSEDITAAGAFMGANAPNLS